MKHPTITMTERNITKSDISVQMDIMTKVLNKMANDGEKYDLVVTLTPKAKKGEKR